MHDSLRGLSVDVLTSRIVEVLKREDHAVLDFVFLLAELKRRSAHLALGFDSLFTYCIEGLKLERSRAFRRSAAAELVERFSLAAELLRSEALSVSALLALNTLLTPENHEELLRRAVGMTEEQARRFASELRPLPASTDSIRLVHTLLPPPPRTEVPTPRFSFGPKLTAPSHTSTSSSAFDFDAATPRSSATESPPLVPTETYRLNVTLSKEVHAQLIAVKHAMAHKVPTGDLNDILGETFKIALAVLERRRIGAPPKNTPSVACEQDRLSADDDLAAVTAPGAPAVIATDPDGIAAALVAADIGPGAATPVRTTELTPATSRPTCAARCGNVMRDAAALSQ